jgi:hypothetical protein
VLLEKSSAAVGAALAGPATILNGPVAAEGEPRRFVTVAREGETGNAANRHADEMAPLSPTPAWR